MVDERVVLGVDVEKIERARVSCEVLFDVAKKAAEEAVFEGMEEVREDGFIGQRLASGVGLAEYKWREDGGLL
jgi:hypothetical protein